MMPFRRPVELCVHPGTYKYFFPPGQVGALWERLAARFGPYRSVPPLGVRELATGALVLRAPPSGNPLTVLRTRPCPDSEIDALHATIGFVEGST